MISNIEALKQATRELAPRRVLMTTAGYKHVLKARQQEILGYCQLADRALSIITPISEAKTGSAFPGIAQLQK